MDVLTREHGIVAACVVLALVALYVLGAADDRAADDRPDWALLAVVIVVGVLLPGRLTGRGRG